MFFLSISEGELLLKDFYISLNTFNILFNKLTKNVLFFKTRKINIYQYI